jgi:hypothetical protein
MIEGRRVRLRSFELSDLDEIMKYWNNIELRNLVGNADRGRFVAMTKKNG